MNPVVAHQKSELIATVEGLRENIRNVANEAHLHHGQGGLIRQDSR